MPLAMRNLAIAQQRQQLSLRLAFKFRTLSPFFYPDVFLVSYSIRFARLSSYRSYTPSPSLLVPH